MGNTYKALLRPALFGMSAERAHGLGKLGLCQEWYWSRTPVRGAVVDERLATTVAGIELKNVIGVSAGIDKNVEMLAAFERLGFGYCVPGTIRKGVEPDNPAPRLVRYPEIESLINCVGLPSKGSRYAEERLRRFRERPRSMAVIPSIQGFTVQEYVDILQLVQDRADAVELLLLCPNERYDEWNFLEPDVFDELMIAVNEIKRKPLFVKVRNFTDEDERKARQRLIELSVEHRVDGLLVPGSRTRDEPRLALGRGNLSGRAVYGETLANVEWVRGIVGDDVAIKALGGVFTGRDAYELLLAGASMVELLTALVYEGPSIANRINRGLLKLMDLDGVQHVRDLVGARST